MIKKIWTIKKVGNLFNLPFIPLIFKAHRIHRNYFEPNEIELCSLLSIKTGTCPEDCAYCPQSGHYHTGVQKTKLLSSDKILKEAKLAKKRGATRFCLGAAWRSPPDKQFSQLLDLIPKIKSLGLETCFSLGMLTQQQAHALKGAGLDFYNHNLDTSRNYYQTIISTRTYDDRLETLTHVRKAHIKVCCGGIISMGESRQDRIALLMELAHLPSYPASIPINHLIPIKGTPLANALPIDPFEFIKTIAITRIMMPKARVRLSAGRLHMTEEMQALCFMAGANSIFLGERLLTAANPSCEKDYQLFKKLGLRTVSSDNFSQLI